MKKPMKVLRRKISGLMTDIFLRMWLGKTHYRHIKELDKQYRLKYLNRKAGK